MSVFMGYTPMAAIAGYRPRLAAWRPAPLAPAPLAPMQLARTSPEMGQRALTLGLLTIDTALSAATAYVGFRLGSQDTGFPKVLGYIVGIAGGIGTILGLFAMLGVSIMPER